MLTLRTVAAALAVGGALLFAGACTDDEVDPENTREAVNDTEDGLLILANGGPAGATDLSLLGQEVTVNGTIATIEDERAFQLAGEETPLLILFEDGLPADAMVGSRVEVDGVARQVLVNTFRNDFGFDFELERYETHIDQVAIDATAVEIVGP